MMVLLRKEALKRIKRNYFKLGHPTAYSGINRISNYYNISQENARSALSNIHSYTLHRDYQKPKYRNPFYAYYLREHWQIDLVDLRSLSSKNDGYKYILMCIDLFSRKCFAKLLKKKTSDEVISKLDLIFNSLIKLPEKILADRGSELKNKKMQKFLREKNVKMIHTKSEIKAGVVERLNRSIENILFQYLTEKETQNYANVFEDIIATYNNRPHSTLKGLTPNEAELPENNHSVLDALNQHYSKVINKNSKTRFPIGTLVRINLLRHKFARGYTEKWSREIFEIINIYKRMPIIMYKLKSVTGNEADEIIDGYFYKNELTEVKNDENVYKIEKILDRRLRNGRRECLIKWLDWPDRFNSWELCSEVNLI